MPGDPCIPVSCGFIDIRMQQLRMELGREEPLVERVRWVGRALFQSNRGVSTDTGRMNY